MALSELVDGLKRDWLLWDALAGNAYEAGNLTACRRFFEAQTRLEQHLGYIGAVAPFALLSEGEGSTDE